jgi:hypothetical protein
MIALTSRPAQHLDAPLILDRAHHGRLALAIVRTASDRNACLLVVNRIRSRW